MNAKQRDEKLIYQIFHKWKSRGLRNKAIEVETAKLDLELNEIKLKNSKLVRLIHKEQIHDIKDTIEEEVNKGETKKSKRPIKHGDPATWD